MGLAFDVPDWDDDAPAILPERLGERHAWESGSGQQPGTKKAAKKEKLKKEKEAAVIQSMLFGASNHEDVEEGNVAKMQKLSKKERMEGKGLTAQQMKQQLETEPKQTKKKQKQTTTESTKNKERNLNEEQEKKQDTNGKKKGNKESLNETQEKKGVKRSIVDEQESKEEDHPIKPSAKKAKTEHSAQGTKAQKGAHTTASESSKQQPNTKRKNETKSGKINQTPKDSPKTETVQKKAPVAAQTGPEAKNSGKKSKRQKLAAMIEDRKRTREEMEAATNKQKEQASEGTAGKQPRAKGQSQTLAKKEKESADGGPHGGSAARKLEGSRFRWVNEQLYTSDSAEAVKLMKETPELFHAYHKGFRSQVDGWLENPVDVIIRWLSTLPPSLSVGDFGCGEAKIAATVRQKVHSFDLVAANESVVACDIAHVPLKAATLDVAIYCLALMGTNFVDFLLEAHRLLKPKGTLKIAEVRSRIPDPKQFVGLLKSLGFDHVHTDTGNAYFLLMEFTKHPTRKPQPDRIQDPTSILKPCIYKRR